MPTGGRFLGRANVRRNNNLDNMSFQERIKESLKLYSDVFIAPRRSFEDFNCRSVGLRES